MRLLILTALLSTSLMAVAQDETDDEATTNKVVNFFANCAGVWDFSSELMAADSKPAVAEHLHNMGNGAEAVALWLLASQHSLDTGTATKYGSWNDMVTPRREGGKLRMYALAELGDFEQIKLDSEACSEAATQQENILQLMRRDRVRDAQDQP